MSSNLCFLFILVVFITNTNCEKKSVGTNNPYILEITDSTKTIQFLNNQAIIFSKNVSSVDEYSDFNRRIYIEQFSTNESSQLFEPNIQDLLKFENKIRQVLISSKIVSELLDENDDSMTAKNIRWLSQSPSPDKIGLLKQYFGFIENSSDSVIYGFYLDLSINKQNYALKSPLMQDWRRFPIVPDDWGIEYHQHRYILNKDSLTLF